MEVSVIIPTYNSARTIGRAINSVLSQQHYDPEIIVVDDGSTDETAEVLHRFKGSIKVIRQANRGVGAARTTGVLAAGGDYIAFLDSDDEWDRKKLKIQLELFRQNPDIGLISTGARFLDSSGRLRNISRPSLAGKLTRLLLFENPIVTSSVILKRDCLRFVQSLFRHDLPVGEDRDMWLRLSVHVDFLVIPSVLVTYHISQTSQARKHSIGFRIALQRKYYEDLLQKPNLSDIVEANWREIQAHLHLREAYLHYVAGSAGLARRAAIRSITTAPEAIRWSRVIPILVLPPALHGYLKSLHYSLQTEKSP